MKNSIRLFGLTLSMSILSHICALPAVSLKELSADCVLDTILLKEQDEQKVQQILNKLPEDICDTLKERMVTRYKLQLFSALSIKTIPPSMIFDDTPVSLSQCGKYALIKSLDMAYLYNLSTGNMVKVLKGVTMVTFSPDEKYMLTDSCDNNALLWNIATGETIEVLTILKGHTGPINSVALSPDGTQALTGSYDNTVRLWDLETGETIKILQSSFSVDTPSSVAFSVCGKYALITTLVGIVRWNLKTGEIVSKLTLSPIVLGSDVLNALANSWDKTVLLLNKILHHARNYRVASITLSSDSKHALTGSADGTVRLWDTTTGQTIAILEGHTGIVTSIALSHDGRYALTGSYDGTACLWDLTTGETVVLEGHICQVAIAVFGPNGNYALIESFNMDLQRDTVYIWDLEHTIKDRTLVQLLSDLRSQISRQVLEASSIKNINCTLL